MRLPHLQSFVAEPLVFLTTATADRRPVLANQVTFDCLETIWRKSAESASWYVGRFVIMPDHVHVFARPARDARSLAEWIKAWKSISARMLARELKLVPPFWQADYFDHFVRSATSYREKWNYVWNNPVRKGLVERPEAWPWHGVINDLDF